MWILGALAAGLLAGEIPIALLVAGAHVAELDVTDTGYRLLGEIATEGALGLPTFLLGLLVLVGMAIWARGSGSKRTG